MPGGGEGAWFEDSAASVATSDRERFPTGSVLRKTGCVERLVLSGSRVAMVGGVGLQPASIFAGREPQYLPEGTREVSLT